MYIWCCNQQHADIISFTCSSLLLLSITNSPSLFVLRDRIRTHLWDLLAAWLYGGRGVGNVEAWRRFYKCLY